MALRSFSVRCLVGSLLLLVATRPALGATYTWNRGAAGSLSWSLNTNWTPNGIPSLAGDMAVVGNSGFGGSIQVITLDTAGLTVGSMFIGAINSTQTGTQTIASGTANTLTFDNLAADAVIVHNPNGKADGISANVAVAGDGNLVVTNSSSNAFTVSGTVSSALASGTQTLTLRTVGSGANVFSGAITDGTSGGVLALKITSGTLTLSGTNSFSGGLIFSGGTLNLNTSNGLGTGLFTLSGSAGRAILASGINIANAITLSPGTGSGIIGDGLITGPATAGQSATLSGPINITATSASGNHFDGGNSTAGLIVTGSITSTVPVSLRANRATFLGGGFYSMFLDSGIVALGANNGLATNAVLELGTSAAGTFDLAGFNQTLAGLQKSTNGAIVGNSSTTSDSTLTITSSGTNTTYAGVIQDVIGSGTHKVGLTLTGGTFTLSNSNSYTGVTSINGGALSLTSSNALAGGGDITFGGGTLRYSGTNALDYSARIKNSTGAISIDTNNQNLTFVIGLASSNTGGLVKLGAGVLTLAGSNSFSGASSVNAGTLNFTNSVSSIGSLAVADASALNVAMVSGSQTVLNTTGLTLGSSGSTSLTFNFGALSNPAAAAINNVGALVVNGTSTFNIAGTNLGLGQFPLITYSTISGFGGLGIGTLPARILANLVNSGSSVDLNITSFDIPKWTGAVDENWDVDDGTGTGTPNWKLAVNGGTTRYLQGSGGTDAVIFDDTATGTTTVTLTTTLTPVTLTVNNDTKTYAFTGNGKLSGATGLVKSGSGTLILANTTPNDYTGGTTINAGTVQLDGTAASLGSGNVTDNGKLVFNRTDNFRFSNVISGTSGVVVKQQSNTLTLSGTNSYAGGTIINAGALRITSAATLGAQSGAATINNGAALITASNAVITTLRNFVLGSGSNAAFVVESGGTYAINGQISGPGSFNKSGFSNNTGTLVLGGSNSFGSGGTVTVDSGVLTLANNNALSGTALLNVLSTTGGSGLTGTRIALSGGVTISGSTTLSLPSAGTTIRSNLVSAGGTNTWSGPIVLAGNDGTVQFGLTAAGAVLNIAGNITNNSFTGTLSFRADGSGGNSIGAIGGLVTGAVILSSTALLTLDEGTSWTFAPASGTNLWGSTQILASSTLQIGNGGTTGNIGGGSVTFSSNSILAYNRTDALVLSNTLTGAGSVIVSSGTLFSTAINSYTGATAINGGVLSASMLGNGGVSSSIGAASNSAANLALNGGTLQYTGTAVTSNRLFSTGTDGATLDASGSGALNLSNTGAIGLSGSGARTLTLTGSNTNTNTLAAAIGDSGGFTQLIKDGFGTWLLTGGTNLIYSGRTQVNKGTLKMNTGADVGDIIVGNGSTFGPIIVTAGLTIASTNFTIGGSGTSTLAFDLGVFGNSTAAPVISTGTLTAGGIVKVNIAGSNLSVGQFALLDYTTINGFNSFSLGTLPPRILASLVNNTTDSSVDLNVTGFDVPKWTGAMNGNWDIDTTGTGGAGTANWKEVSSGNTTRYLQGSAGMDTVLFDDSATGVTTINLAAALSPSGFTVNNNMKAYAFTGSGKLSGATGLIKSGSGTLTIANMGTNDYTGGTVILSGTLQVGDGTTAGAGNLGSGSVSNEGTLVFNRPDNLAFTNSINGSGSLSQQGSGTLILTASSSYTGTTSIKAGMLIVSGSLSASSTVIVGDSANPATTAALGGPGRVGNVTVGASVNNTGAMVDPGAVSNIGNLTTGSLTFAGNKAHLSIQLGQTAASNPVAGTNNDVVTTTGAVTLNGADLALALNIGFNLSGDKLYFIINNNTAQSGGVANLGQLTYSSTLLGQDSSFTVGGQQFQISYNADFSSRTFDGTGNDIALLAVPESETCVLMLVGWGAFWLLHVRHAFMRCRKK